MIQAIVFDCFGVLTSDKWKEFIAAQPADKVQAIRDIHAQFDKHLISYEDFRNGVAKLSDAPTAELDDVFLIETYRPKNDPIFVFIKELKQQYKIGLLSNVGTGWIQDEFLSDEEQQLFDTMVFSYQVQMAKPDKEIFDLTAKRLGIDPQNCVLIDDAMPNCEGAKRAGWQSIFYENLGQLKNDLAALLS